MLVVRPEGNGVVRTLEEPDPAPGPGEVLIATAVSALCGSELHSYRGAGSKKGNGGHEAAGTVVRLGEGVSRLRVGQRVGASAIAGCGECPCCRKGQYTWCARHRFYGNMHAERFVAGANACQPLPDDVSWDVGVLLSGDGIGVPYHTSTKIASPEVKTVAVFGVGPIGLGNVLVQSHLGRRVIAVDVSAARLEIARRLGAAEVVTGGSEEIVLERIRSLTGGAGADACIEAAGRPETALQCFASVRTAGTVVFNGEQGPVGLSPSDHFIRRDITAVGAWYYHFGEFEPMLALYRRGLRVGELISHRYPLREAAAAFEKFSSGQSAKVLLTYDAQEGT
jgi:threonine dehydrogenase-like Zn-dependent dehydrogenase